MFCGLATGTARISATGSLPSARISAKWFRGQRFSRGMQFFNMVMFLQAIVGGNAAIVASTATTRG
jgi:hypothetical protein